MNILYFVARTSKQNLFSLIFEVVIKGCMTGGAWIQRATLQRATLQRAKLHCFFQDSHFFQFFSFSFKSVMAISASWIFLGRSSNFSSSSVMAVWTSLTFLEISSKWSKILDGSIILVAGLVGFESMLILICVEFSLYLDENCFYPLSIWRENGKVSSKGNGSENKSTCLRKYVKWQKAILCMHCFDEFWNIPILNKT